MAWTSNAIVEAIGNINCETEEQAKRLIRTHINIIISNQKTIQEAILAIEKARTALKNIDYVQVTDKEILG